MMRDHMGSGGCGEKANKNSMPPTAIHSQPSQEREGRGIGASGVGGGSLSYRPGIPVRKDFGYGQLRVYLWCEPGRDRMFSVNAYRDTPDCLASAPRNLA